MLHRSSLRRCASVCVFTIIASVSFVVPTPPARAQVSCPNDVNGRACPVGRFWCGVNCYTQAQINLIANSCTGGRVFTGCGTCACACPADKQYFCNGACTATSFTGTACDAGFGPGSGVYGDACGTNCVAIAEENILFAPRARQSKTTDRPLIDIEQRGGGELLSLRRDGTTVIGANQTGLQLGGITLDLGPANIGQNLIYGIAKFTGMNPADALMLFQTADDAGAVTDRLRLDREGKLTVDSVCLSGTCRSTWTPEAEANVVLQPSSPGTAQSGNFSITGIGRMSLGRMATLELGERATPVLNARGPIVVGENLPFYVNSDGGIQFRVDANDDVDGIAEVAEFGVNNGANQRVFEVFESGVLSVYAPGSVASALRLSPAPTPGWPMLTLTAPITDPSWSGKFVELGSPEGTQFSVESDGTMRTRRGFFSGYPFASGALDDPILLVSGVGGTHFSVDADGDIVGRGRMTMNGPIIGHGRATLDGAPLGATVLGGSLVLNPSTSAFDATLLGIAKNGAQLFRFDTDGDLQIARDTTVTRNLDVNGTSFIGKVITSKFCLGVTECTVACSTGKMVLGGGCTTTRPLDSSYPSTERQWTCRTNGAITADMTAYAICARVDN